MGRTSSTAVPRNQHTTLAGGLLGFALGGFFDGILLHQILQWHHLLSAIESAPFRNIQMQIMMDGFFHALMYVLALVGLWLLWRQRVSFAVAGTGRLLAANAMIGFGLWHVLDGVLSHWILGLHRIRMDSSNPLFWDLLWFLVFGVGVVAIGFWLRRRPSGNNLSGARGHIAAIVLAVAVSATGPISAIPPAESRTVMVLFSENTPPEQVFASAAEADARLVWSDSSGRLWAIALSDRGDTGTFYQYGALAVSGNFLTAACLDWTVL